ncbi:hypothetical protein JM18_009909, partial [Phytophthora kernoviae]
LAIATALTFVVKNTTAFTIGTPTGLAAGTTGGGNGTVVYPTTTAELVKYLNASEPLVVVLNQTFDFRGTEGTTTEEGCRPDYTRECMAKNNGFKSQDVIIQGGNMETTGGCTGGTSVTVTYDNAPLKRMNVKGDKTIRGIGKKGVIIGKGLTLNGDNIILQNIHITELNRHLVWGGDAIYMQGTDKGKTPMNKIWLDHIKVSRVGRQFLTTNKASASSMTISNSDFDGETDYSATCDGHHYWSFIFYGENTRFSMLNNYIHATSGRSPKIGGDSAANVVAHVANNYWGNNSGHSFEIGINAWVLAEGNYFSNTRMPLYTGKDGSFYAADGTDDCTKYLGRSCPANVMVNSGDFTSRDGLTALEKIKSYPAMTSYTSGATQSSGSEQQSTQTTQSQQQQSFQTSDLENEWAETTTNFGVGKLD